MIFSTHGRKRSHKDWWLFKLMTFTNCSCADFFACKCDVTEHKCQTFLSALHSRSQWHKMRQKYSNFSALKMVILLNFGAKIQIIFDAFWGYFYLLCTFIADAGDAAKICHSSRLTLGTAKWIVTSVETPFRDLILKQMGKRSVKKTMKKWVEIIFVSKLYFEHIYFDTEISENLRWMSSTHQWNLLHQRW